ncbi:early activation antigen CD69-like [Hemicordylus capensis]|uniref:early activation antigen CD69-like n=1 Tax=Hemicordylus capensis TaxID=884348 RepID=UPI00230459A8|nr:early activation antigen CD69-like [Hemicordylus capensis]XP_053144690.1 early activation antigen CD69-like [Hemicordylus capensis]
MDILMLIIVIIITVCLHGRTPQCPDTPAPVPSTACPSRWINYKGKCYFFSEEERDWTSAQSFCTSRGSSLAVIQSEPEKVFMLRYMGNIGHWFGLRKDPHQTWKWADGTEFNNILELKGENGDCAYLSTGFAMSLHCSVRRNWICSQPDAYTRSKGPAVGG